MSTRQRSQHQTGWQLLSAVSLSTSSVIVPYKRQVTGKNVVGVSRHRQMHGMETWSWWHNICGCWIHHINNVGEIMTSAPTTLIVNASLSLTDTSQILLNRLPKGDNQQLQSSAEDTDPTWPTEDELSINSQISQLQTGLDVGRCWSTLCPTVRFGGGTT